MQLAFLKSLSRAGSRFVRRAACTLLLLPIVALELSAQTPEEVRALRSRQVAAIEQIEQKAFARGASGTPERTAGLRAGLMALGEIAAGRFDFDPAGSIVQDEAPQLIDSDPMFQRRVAKRYEAARLALKENPDDQGAVRGRVIGGRPVKDPEFGSTVAIVQASRPECSGSYLGGGRVLTAAHCVCQLGLDLLGLGWRVAFGDHVPGGVLNEKKQRPLAIDPKKTSIFPAVNGGRSDFCRVYNRTDLVTAAGLDLAILTIAEAVPDTFPTTRLGSQDVLSAALAEDGDLAHPFLAVGFGKYWKDGRLAAHGRKNAAFILSGELCPSSGRLGLDNLPCLAAREVSAFDASSRDTCAHDSGGPLFAAGTEPNDWRLIGVTSRALRKSGSCGGGGVYVLVTTTEVGKWLRDNEVRLPQ